MKHLAWILVLPAAYLLLTADVFVLLGMAIVAGVVLAALWIGAGRLDRLEEGS